MTPAVQQDPKPTLMTAEEFASQYANHRAELVRGQVVEVPMPSQKHGKICARTTFLLSKNAEESESGHVTSNNSFVRTEKSPDSVRGADVCFFRYARLPKGNFPEGLLEVQPELVVEVRSSSDRWTTLFARASEYLEAGIMVVVILDPKTESATVFRAEDGLTTFEKDKTLTLPDVLPGFAVPVRAFFE